jgi:hypothetical protein
LSAKRSRGLDSGASATARLACILPVTAAVALGCLQLFGASSFAHDEISTVAPEDDAPLDMSRDQWRERVAEARRRARQFTLEHRGRPVFDTSSKADEEVEVDDRPSISKPAHGTLPSTLHNTLGICPGVVADTGFGGRKLSAASRCFSIAIRCSSLVRKNRARRRMHSSSALVNDHDREYFHCRSAQARQVVVAGTFVSLFCESRCARDGFLQALDQRHVLEVEGHLIDRG